MQFKDIENKLFIYHKANNRPFYRVLLVIGTFILPIIFLFLPLPGYWALSVSVFDVRFIGSILFFCLIIAGLLKFHAAVFHKRYFFWAIDTFGVSKFRFLYCASRIKFCAPVFLLLLAGFIQANVAVHTIFRLILVVGILVAFIIFLSLRQLDSKDVGDNLGLVMPIHAKFIFTVCSRIYLRLMSLLCLTTLVTFLVFGSPNGAFDIGAVLLGFILNISLLTSCTKYLLNAFSQHEYFFLSLSNDYFNYQRAVYRVCIVTLWLINLVPMVVFIG
jgi:hypothetical protein